MGKIDVVSVASYGTCITVCFGKSCSTSLPCVSFVNVINLSVCCLSVILFFYLPEVFTALIQGIKIDAVAYLGLLAQVCKVNPKAAASPLTAFSVGIRDFRLTLSDQ